MKQINNHLLHVILLFLVATPGCNKEKEFTHNPSQPIVIDRFSPGQGGAGAEVLIYGENFNSDTAGVTVMVNGKKAVVTGVVHNRILFLVPGNAGSGKITVTINGQSGSSTTDFKYIPVQYVYTLTGTGQAGFADGDSSRAMFSFSLGAGMALDHAGNIYVSDADNERIRKITPDGTVSTLAGSSAGGYQDGTGSDAMFNHPYGLAVDKDNNVYVADTWNGALRKITPGGQVTTPVWLGDIVDVAIDKRNGNIYLAAYGPGIIYRLHTDGSLEEVGSGFQQLAAIAVDSEGNIYGVDNARSFIGRVDADTHEMKIIAGISGQTGLVNGPGDQAKFDRPWGIAIDANDNLYVAGNGGPNYGGGSGNTNQCIRFIEAGTWKVSTYAGGSNSGFVNGIGTMAMFNSPTGVAVTDDGIVYVLDEGNQRIRKIISK